MSFFIYITSLSFLTTHDNDMPQCGFDDTECVDVALFETDLVAEPPPTLHKQVAAILAWVSMHRSQNFVLLIDVLSLIVQGFRSPTASQKTLGKACNHCNNGIGFK
jgi:hypothetical protein